YTYRNFYNGGGVGLGDVNNDGLIDIYFTSNQGPNKLYLNKGDFKFEDITGKSGVAGTKAWSTGVSLADVNGDGWLDIYVANSGDIKGAGKENELFINNGDLTFSEKAAEYGVADRGFTTHAAFFDYDKDNDLDLYILNNSYTAIGSFNLTKNERPKRDSLGGDKLLRNDNGHFKDVSEHAGIYGSVIGFGLGVTVGDVDHDGWQDIYVSNDFFERDYLYINNHDGTFKESLTEQMKSVSGASMGADLADINNDGNPDIFVTEMLPWQNKRLKTVTTFESWDRYNFSVQNGYYHQFTRNMLQLNNGDGTFSEIGRLAGVEATDWSWAALMFDMDNDGWRDIFVSNGIYQDLTNQDYLQYISNEEVVRSIVAGGKVDYKKLVELIPSNAVPNQAFHNKHGIQFNEVSKEWGLNEPDFSNGAAYGDLDNDGDLDIVINNVNSLASIYRNNTDESTAKYLKFILKGPRGNTGAFGTRITIKDKGQTFYGEQMPIRGFESSVDPRPNFGLGARESVDEVLVQWPDGTEYRMTDVSTNQIINLDMTRDSEKPREYHEAVAAPIFTPIPDLIDYTHKEAQFVDFDRDRLIFHMLSNEGPRMSKADVNGDGLEDIYIGGAKGSPRALFIQERSGKFIKSNEKVFATDETSEDMGSEFLDVDKDGDMDLYVCSGGNELPSTSSALADRLYINDGKGNFTKSPSMVMSSKYESNSTVKGGDYDGDGDTDLFVGERLRPFAYGLPCRGYILRSDNGVLKDVTKDIAPALIGVGMITDAAWNDIDHDRDLDLVVVGEYMPVKIFVNNNGKFDDLTEEFGLEKTNGWWNRIQVSDLDGDGYDDFVLGNHGLNSRVRASMQKPVCMYINDFDQNGTMEQIVCTFNGEKSYPLALRHDLISQMPFLKKKYLKYESYEDQTIENIFTPEQLKNATKLEAYYLQTSILWNKQGTGLSLTSLPLEAQLSPVYGIQVGDFNNDGNRDLLLGGNQYRVKPELGRYDASFGTFLAGDGKGNFMAQPASLGWKIDGEIRDITTVNVGGQKVIVVARSNSPVVTLSSKK
ncbi:MAG TPA: VCBS repeat-containing protein, partial [Cyclobacteriaceae bacterium]|nr:VCBS repeat-containing protein [Cyclobacteriaceae bacterium]